MGVDIAAEEQFGPYLIYERLGIGGMATVHRALERGIEGFERIVALKRLLPHLAEDGSFIKSFVREAKLASLLNHVNIVQIFELGRVGTEYFISMEHIDGRDIRRILRHARKVTGPPPIHVTVGLLLQLCDALDYAHGKVDDHGVPLGLVHRDVSPSNLLITQAGHLKVIDFGIARAQSTQLRTQTGRVKGKLAYMAPEAIAGKDLDSRSDLFACGVIAHELLTARPLFASKNEYQTLLKVQRGEIMPPSTFNQACPAELDAIVLKALARDPEDRFATAAELRDELLEMRRRYNLQTGHRDVAQWIDWAFSLEPPSGGFGSTNTIDQTGSTGLGSSSSIPVQGKLRPTPRPRRDDEEAVEIAWGGGDQEHDGLPVVLDDVPDVSEKHLGGSSVVIVGPAALHDDDDIPPPQPSHGPATRPRAKTAPSSRAITPQPARGSTPELPARVSQSNISRLAGSNNAVAAASLAPPRVQRPSTSQMPVVPRAITPTERPSSALEARTPHSMAEIGESDELLELQPIVSDEPYASPASPASPAAAAASVRSASIPALVRFSETAQIPLDVPSLEQPRIPNTRPGHQPAHARGSTSIPIERPITGPIARPSTGPVERRSGELDAEGERRFQRESQVSIGSAIVARQSVRRTWVMVAGLAVAGAAAVGVAIYATGHRGKSSDQAELAPKQPGRTHGTVKFVTEPADAEISIEGRPVQKGSPWTIELPAGIHQIQIQRAGYKAWLTSLELSANETQTLRVVLEPLGSSAAAAGEATLILSSTPLGLEIVLDGQALPQKTPVKLPLKPGAHTIALRDGGVEVWRHEVTAQASVDYEFSPSMAAEKQRERAERAAPVKKRVVVERETSGGEPQTVPAGAASPATPDKTVDKTIDKTIDKSKPAAGTPIVPPPVVPPTPAIVTPPPAEGSAAPPTPAVAQPVLPPTPPIAIAPKLGDGPQIVAPGQVKRLEGETPIVKKSKNNTTPPVITAKVCINAGGKVTNVDVLSKLERMTVTDLTRTLRDWVYAPYLRDGAAVPVCFVVSFRSR